MERESFLITGCGMEADYPAFENPLCGEFKHIYQRIKETYKEIKEDLTPYKDDRYYRLAPMRLYTLSKRHFVLVFVVFFICFGLTVLIGIADNKLDSLKISFIMSVTIRGVLKNGSVRYYNKETHNRTRIFNCAKDCDEIIVVHLGYLNFTRYNIVVTFNKFPEIYHLKSYNFTWKTYNPAFSQVEIWFRFVFVVLTFIVTCLFAHSLRKFSMRDWGIEQKWMSILLPLLLLYNDPFFPLSFLINSWFPGMLDDLFQSLFLCALLLFWLCVYHGIRVQGERKCMTFYFPKFLIVGLLWLASVTLGIWQTVNELHDPTYQYETDTNNFQGMKIFFLVVATVYILYLLFLIIRACSELRNMPYVDLRLKFLTALTFIVLIISIVIFYLRFGAQVLQDNFVAELSTHYHNYILLL
ncbi:hypothetical protein Chor_006565 [Crotalus horridus]